MRVKDYLVKPYSRCFVPSGGGFTGYILEFPGCITEGKTLRETYRRLEKVAESWIGAALELGQDIPEPHDNAWRPVNSITIIGKYSNNLNGTTTTFKDVPFTYTI